MKKPVSIRVRCPSCADVRIDATKLTIRVCTDTKQWSYCFLCPACGYAVAHDSDNGMLAEISGMGVKTVVWHLPGELSEPKPGGPPVHVGRPARLPSLLAGRRAVRGRRDAGRARARSGFVARDESLRSAQRRPARARRGRVRDLERSPLVVGPRSRHRELSSGVGDDGRFGCRAARARADAESPDVRASCSRALTRRGRRCGARPARVLRHRDCAGPAGRARRERGGACARRQRDAGEHLGLARPIGQPRRAPSGRTCRARRSTRRSR